MAVGDASDTTQSAHGSLDKITIPNFFASIPTPVNVTSASATALAVGRLGATTPAFTVDASTGSQVAGLKVVGAVTTGTVAVVVTDSGAVNTNLTINALGSGTIGIGSVSTGRVTITPVTTITGSLTLSAALVYGGVMLSNAVTGTGNMVLSAGPTLTGTVALATFAATAASTVFVASSTTPALTVGTGTAHPTTLSPAGAILSLVGNTVPARYFAVAGENSLDNFGKFGGALCGGTVASPSATPNNKTMASFEARGYGTGWVDAGAGAVWIMSAELWTATANGTKIVFRTTPNGTTTAATVLTLGQDASATFAGAVSGITTLATTNDVTIDHASASTVLTLGNSSDVTDAKIRLLVGSTHVGWLIAAQNNINQGLEFTPSTANGGTTFSTPVMSITSAGALTVTGAFGCNTKAAQTAYASGGALAAYGAGANGLDSGANMSALHALVVNIRAALVANGIMS